MQTVQLKYDIMSWVVGLTDKSLIQKLYQWKEEQETAAISTEIVSKKQNRNLTKGFGIWVDKVPFNEHNLQRYIMATGKKYLVDTWIC